MNTVSIISLCFSGVMMIIGVTSFIITQSKTSKKEIETSERQLNVIREDILQVRMKLDEVGTVVTETKGDVKGLTVNINEIDKRLTRVETNLETAFVRIDELKENKQDKE